MRPHGMTNGNHILHDDKTRGEEQDLPRCLALGGEAPEAKFFETHYMLIPFGLR